VVRVVPRAVACGPVVELPGVVVRQRLAGEERGDERAYRVRVVLPGGRAEAGRRVEVRPGRDGERFVAVESSGDSRRDLHVAVLGRVTGQRREGPRRVLVEQERAVGLRYDGERPGVGVVCPVGSADRRVRRRPGVRPEHEQAAALRPLRTGCSGVTLVTLRTGHR